jgi:predicted alpha/beta hydrolase
MPLMKEFVNVIARDGTSLSATWYITDVPQHIVVLIAPATGVKQTYYKDFAEWLASLGLMCTHLIIAVLVNHVPRRYGTS